MQEEPYVIAAITQGLLLGGMRVGIDPRDVLKRVGLGIEVLEDTDSPVPYEKQIEVTREVLLYKPHLNSSLQIGKHFVPQRFGLLGRMLQYGATFEQALKDFSRFQHLTTNIVSQTMSRVPEGVRITIETHPTIRSHPSFHAIPAIHEAPLAVPLALGRHLTGRHIRPLRVSFRHQSVGDRSEHEEFFAAPVRFGMPADEMIFSQETLDTPLLTTDGVKYQRTLDLVLAHIDPVAKLQPVGATLRQRLLQILHEGAPDIAVVARSMAMSTRTLQRRLASEGASFESVLDQARRDLLLQYLVDPAFSTCELAGLVGFAEPSPFFRAFRRWFGCTPKQWRLKNRIL
jgi:AraC-like DNA-binding protein